MAKKIKMNDEVYIGNSNVQVRDLLGTLLWTNSNSKNEFEKTKITIKNVVDYDVLEIWYKAHTGSIGIMSRKIITKCGGELFKGTTDTSGNAIFYQRAIEYIDENTIQINNCRVENVGYYPSLLIPVYIVGYKTGLFS